MPIRPGSTETHDEFISRCMSEEASSFPNQEQRYAVCESMWSEGKMSKVKTSQQRVLSKLNILTGRELQEYKGIDMNKVNQGFDLDEACQPGWKALGTKILRGRTVPNCIPESEHPDNN